jgi:hypothetical protein
LARLKLKRDEASKRCSEGVEEFVAQVVPTCFFAFINNAKVLKKLDDLFKGLPFDWHILLPTFKRLRNIPNNR